MQDLSIRDYSELLKKLYDGALEASPWQSFLTAVKEVLNLQACFLFLRYPTHTDGGLMFTSGTIQPVTPENPSNIYTEGYFAADPLVNLPVGKVVNLDELIDREQFDRSEFYQICMQPHDIYFTAGVDLEYDNKERFSVRFTRTYQQGPFSADEQAFMQMLSEHIQRAVALGDKLIRLDSERQLWASSVSGRSIGVVMLDETGTIVRVNALAERYLREKDGLSQVHNKLHIQKTKLNHLLRTYIQQALDAQKQDKQVPVNALAVPRQSNQPDYEVVIKPVPFDPMIDSRGSPHLSVLIYAPEQRSEVNLRLLVKLYGLTVTEASVAIMLARGETLDEVAANLDMARNTARAHLRSIFSKTGVTQQSMLVSLVLKSLASLP